MSREGCIIPHLNLVNKRLQLISIPFVWVIDWDLCIFGENSRLTELSHGKQYTQQRPELEKPFSNWASSFHEQGHSGQNQF